MTESALYEKRRMSGSGVLMGHPDSAQNVQSSPFAADRATALRIAQFRTGPDLAQHKLEIVLKVLQHVGWQDPRGQFWLQKRSWQSRARTRRVLDFVGGHGVKVAMQVPVVQLRSSRSWVSERLSLADQRERREGAPGANRTCPSPACTRRVPRCARGASRCRARGRTTPARYRHA